MSDVISTEALSQEQVAQVLVDLRGFGITDTEEAITITLQGRTVSLRLSTISPEDEIQTLIANLEIKGHAWVHQMRCDLLARAITWINGVKVEEGTYSTDPYTKEERPVRAIMRDVFRRWGKEVVLTLWKVYMVHCQRVEDNLIEQLPDSTIMTQAEARFMAQVADELKALGVEALTDTADVASAESAQE